MEVGGQFYKDVTSILAANPTRSFPSHTNYLAITWELLGNYSGQFLIDQLRKIHERLRAYDRKSIDEEGRRGLYPKSKRKIHIGLNECVMVSAGKTGCKSIHVQTEINGISNVSCFVQCFTAE